MRIFLAGASGAVGKRLVPALVIKGHQVVGMVALPGKSGLGEIAGRRTDRCERTRCRCGPASRGPLSTGGHHQPDDGAIPGF